MKISNAYSKTSVEKNKVREHLENQKKKWEPGDVELAAQLAVKKAGETIGNILAGAFPARPTIRGTDKPPCDYCNWRAACGYDDRLERNKPLPKISDENIKIDILQEITDKTEY